MVVFMNDKYEKILFREVKKAYKNNNVPVSAIIVKDGKVIAKAHNMKNSTNISIAHAEIIAIKRACKKLKTWILSDCILYTTLKPCKMCEGAINESRISKVYYILDSNYHKNFVNNINYYKIADKISYSKLLNTFFDKLR